MTRYRSKLKMDMWISATKLRSFLECAYQPALSKKAKPRLSKWKVGTAVHDAIERLAKSTRSNYVDQQQLCASLGEHFGDSRTRYTTEERARAFEIMQSVSRLQIGPQLCPPETSFEVDLGGGVGLRGRWDLVRGTEEDVEVVDWKCVFPSVNSPEAKSDPQVGLYLVAARERWPHAKTISVVLKYLNEPRNIVESWTPQLDAYWRAQGKAAARQLDRGYQEPTTGTHCAFCPVMNQCEFAKQVSQDEHDLPAEKLTPEELAWTAYLIRTTTKINDQAKKDIDKRLLSLIESSEDKKIQTADVVASMRSREVRRVSPESLPELAAEAGVSLKHVLQKAVSGIHYDELKRALGGAKAPELSHHTNTFKTQYLDVRRKK